MWEPTSWREALDRIGVLLGPEDAEEWIREVVRLRWGTDSIRALSPADRMFAFGSTRAAVVYLEEDGVPIEIPDDGHPRVVRWVLHLCGSIEPAPEHATRHRVAAAFERAFGVRPDGPPWEVGWEPHLPTRAEWADPLAAGHAE